MKILNFGSSWWARFGSDPEDRYRFTRHAAYFNSTGLRSGNKVRRYWTLPGLIRFNGVGSFNPHFPRRSVGETFECTDLAFALGGNRILFERKAACSASPDYFLTVLSRDRFGAFDFRSCSWKSASVLPVAVSESDDRQEAMLLMKPQDWVLTSLGTWQLKIGLELTLGASLELIEAEVVS